MLALKNFDWNGANVSKEIHEFDQHKLVEVFFLPTFKCRLAKPVFK